VRLVHLGSPVGLPTEQAHAFQITKMCEAFADAGHQTRLLCAAPPEVLPAEMVESIFDRYAVRPVFEIKTLRCLGPRFLEKRFSRAWRFVRSVSYALHAYFHIMRHCNDDETILYSRERFTTYLLLLSGRWVRSKHIFESHNFLGEKHPDLIAALFKKLDRLVAMTPRIRELYVDAGVPGDKVLVAANGVDPAHFLITESQAECRERLGLPADRPVIGYIGNFRNTMGMEKGIPELLRAHALLLQRFPRNPPFLVCVGGPAGSVPAYRQIAVDLDMSPEHYRFAGFAARSEVPRWMRSCDVLTIPWPKNEWAAHQTSPIKLYEYMAAAVPIAATDLPSIRQVLVPELNAVLAAAGNIEAFADAVAGLLSDPEKGQRLATSARQAVAEFTWANRAKRVLEGIAQVDE